jgi:hypothetical protein
MAHDWEPLTPADDNFWPGVGVGIMIGFVLAIFLMIVL